MRPGWSICRKRVAVADVVIRPANSDESKIIAGGELGGCRTVGGKYEPQDEESKDPFQRRALEREKSTPKCPLERGVQQ